VNAVKRHKPRCSCYCTPSYRRIDTVIREQLKARMPSSPAHDPREFVVIVWLSILPLTWLATWCRVLEKTTVLQSDINILPQVSVKYPACISLYLVNATWSAYLPNLDLITRIIFAEERRLCSSSLCSLFSLPCCLIPSASIYPIFQLPQPVSLLCESASFTPIYNGQNYISVYFKLYSLWIANWETNDARLNDSKLYLSSICS
jgi:hypothetical protein